MTPAEMRDLAATVGVPGYNRLDNGIKNAIPGSHGDKHVVTMAAIAQVESGGNPNAVNPDGDATGLWQIRWSVWGKTLQKKGIAKTQAELKDPNVNAKAMKVVLDEQGLSAWTTYNNRNKSGNKAKWDQAFTDAQKGISASQDFTGTDKPDLNPIAAVEKGIAALADTFMKIAGQFVLLFVILAFVGIAFFILNRDAVKKVAKGAAKLTPVGRVVTK